MILTNVNKNLRQGSHLFLMILFILLYSATSLADSSLADKPIYLGEGIASKEQIIDILKPKNTASRKIVVRGLQLHPNAGGEVDSRDTQADIPRALALVVNFEFDSAALTPTAIQQLTPLAEALSSDELTSVSFTLEGHTDAKGSKEYNLNLSNRRALSVKQFLANRYSLDPNRVNAYGKGEEELLKGSMPFSRENRRVVVIAH